MTVLGCIVVRRRLLVAALYALTIFTLIMSSTSYLPVSEGVSLRFLRVDLAAVALLGAAMLDSVVLSRLFAGIGGGLRVFWCSVCLEVMASTQDALCEPGLSTSLITSYT